MSGLTCLAPATKPASNFSSSGVWTPPMKPTLSDVLLSAAAAPTRNEPCSSAKTRALTFSASTCSSMRKKVVSGKSPAISGSSSA
jgi:hypothetical protein